MVPCKAVTVPLTGNVTDVVIYAWTGCGKEVTDTLPEIGKVVDVDMYTVHGVVPCVAVTVPVIGNTVDVTTYACTGCGNEVTETLPVIGNVVLVEM